MLDSLLNTTTIPLLEKMAAFGERRQEVLAGNIANIDTPLYKMRDLPVNDFQQALQEAVRHRGSVPPSDVTLQSPGQARTGVDSYFPAELFKAREAASDNLTFYDANNRSIEKQVTEMTKNSMMQQFAVEIMSAQMNMLQMVISERA